MIPILQMGKLRHRAVKQYALSHLRGQGCQALEPLTVSVSLGGSPETPEEAGLPGCVL